MVSFKRKGGRNLILGWLGSYQWDLSLWKTAEEWNILPQPAQKLRKGNWERETESWLEQQRLDSPLGVAFKRKGASSVKRNDAKLLQAEEWARVW